jgi:hypothetical protein
MALARRKPQPLRQPTDEWVKILTADPARPQRPLVTEISAAGVGLFAGSLLFFLGTILIQPFLLYFHITKYPNLAASSFTSIALAAGALTLVTLSFLYLILRPYLFLVNFAFGIVAGLLVAVIVGTFFFLFGREVILWLLNPDGWPRIVNAFKDLFQFILDFLKSI